MSQPTTLVWEGPQFTQESLAKVNRELCTELARCGDLELYLRSEKSEVPGAPGDPDVHVRHAWPPDFSPPSSGAWVVMQPWEYGGLPADWIPPMRDQVDEVWVYTSWLRDCYIRSGVPGDRVVVVPLGVDTETFGPQGEAFPLTRKARTIFLFVGGTIERKGIDILLDVYLRTFSAEDDVCLVIKSTGSDSFYRGQSIDDYIRGLAARPGTPAIELIAAALSDREMASLYRAADVLVQPYRAEGFGLPIAEAMACGLPVIVTGYGACLDFCDARTAYLLPATCVPISPPGGLGESPVGYWWAEPDRDSLAATMRDVVAEPDSARAKASRARERISREFTWQVAAQRARDRLKMLGRPRRTPRRLTPLHLDGRRGTAFLYVPDWSSSQWKNVLSSYAAAFGPSDDVTLVLWLDPAHGVSEAEAGARLSEALAGGGVNEDVVPDILLVAGAVEQERLRAAVDWIVPDTTMRPESWRAVTGSAKETV